MDINNITLEDLTSLLEDMYAETAGSFNDYGRSAMDYERDSVAETRRFLRKKLPAIKHEIDVVFSGDEHFNFYDEKERESKFDMCRRLISEMDPESIGFTPRGEKTEVLAVDDDVKDITWLFYITGHENGLLKSKLILTWGGLAS